MHVDPDDMLGWTHLGQFDQCLATTEADVNDHVSDDAEDFAEGQLRTPFSDSPPGNPALVGNNPRRRQATAAGLERALWRVQQAR